MSERDTYRVGSVYHKLIEAFVAIDWTLNNRQLYELANLLESSRKDCTNGDPTMLLAHNQMLVVINQQIAINERNAA